MKDNQEMLIRHLIRFHILDYESCLQVLDTEDTGDKIAMSYVFRPLTKHKYIIKGKDGIVSVLKKGKELFPEEEPLISIGVGLNPGREFCKCPRWLQCWRKSVLR